MKKFGFVAAVLVALVSFASCDNVVRDPLKGNTFANEDAEIEFGTDGAFTATTSHVVYNGTYSVNPIAHTFSVTVTSYSCPDQEFLPGEFDTFRDYYIALMKAYEPDATDEEIEEYVDEYCEYVIADSEAYVAAFANGEIGPDNDAIGVDIDYDGDGEGDEFIEFYLGGGLILHS